MTLPTSLIPAAAIRAFQQGEEHHALTLLRRARDAQPPHSPGWAYLERLVGLVLIHLQREVEGTFALERADPLLDGQGWARPGLDALQES